MKKFLTDSPIKQQNVTFKPFKEGPRAETIEDGSELHRFRFAFPRGTLDKRMSGKELSIFILNHLFSILNMRLLDYSDYVCKCGWKSRLMPEDNVCPFCNHKCTTVNRTEIQEEFRRIFWKFVTVQEVEVQYTNERFGDYLLGKPIKAKVLQYELKGGLDDLLPWVRVTRGGESSHIPGQPTEDHDFIELNLHDLRPYEERKFTSLAIK